MTVLLVPHPLYSSMSVSVVPHPVYSNMLLFYLVQYSIGSIQVSLYKYVCFRGATSCVFKCEQRGTGTNWAVKIINKNVSGGDHKRRELSCEHAALVIYASESSWHQVQLSIKMGRDFFSSFKSINTCVGLTLPVLPSCTQRAL